MDKHNVVIYKIEYNSTFKVILTQALMWLNLEVNILIETNQTQKDKGYHSASMRHIQISQFQTQSRIRLPGIESGECLFNGYSFTLGK